MSLSFPTENVEWRFTYYWFHLPTGKHGCSQYEYGSAPVKDCFQYKDE